MKQVDPNQFVGRELTRHGTAAELQRSHGKARTTRWSSKQPGFGVREYASRRRMYVVQGNWRGRTETVTIGNTAVIDERRVLDVARRCLYVAGDAAAPADERKRKRAAPMFQDFVATFWERVSPGWKPSTLKSENEYRAAYVDAMFRDKGIDEITREDMAKWMIEATRSGSSGAANRAFDRVKAIFNKAIEWGHRPEGTNPCNGVKRNKMPKVERFLSPKEFQRLGEAMERHRRAWPIHDVALSLLTLTGCRMSEITGLRWREVRGSRLHLEDSKTGARTVQLCRDAAWMLGTLKRRTPEAYVFDTGNGRPMSIAKFWQAVRRDAGLSDVRMRDLRHSYASHAARLALPLPVSQQLLGHSRMESTARYTHFNDAHLFDIANRISELIDDACQRRG